MSKLNKAIFLDRDGVINKERKDYVKNIDELELEPNIDHYVKQLKNSGFLVIVITNQSAINRNLTTHKNVQDIHQSIQQVLQSKNTSIDSFYYCPHRPDENCDCRKPKIGLLIKAKLDFKIDIKSSWFIGDNDSDVETAKSFGCKYIKISSNFPLESAIKEILNSQ
jgi:histidinol-phosphate phosphatase family protein